MEFTTTLEIEDNLGLLFPRQKTGILGGTFNPIHNGHVDMALRLRVEYQLEKVMLIPAYIPPHKQNSPDVAPPQKRLHMVAMCVYEHGQELEMSDMEVKREGVSYTVDTLRELNRKYPETDFYFIIGSDTLFELEGWKDFPEICRLTQFICVQREGDDRISMTAEAARLEKQHGATIFLSEYKGLAISSSNIRERVREGKSIAGFVPPAVEEYINESGLYK